MPQKRSRCKDSVSRRSLNFSTDAYYISVKAHQNLLRVISNLYWLQRHEPIYHCFKNRHVLSDRDIAAYREYVGLAEEICNEGGQA